MAGILYGIGVGPGDAELLTLKAVHRIRECDVIGIPAETKETCTAYQIGKQAVPEIEEKEVLSIPLPMTKEEACRRRAYEAGAGKLIETLAAGKSIGFLNLGDPTIYSTFMELYDRVKQAGYPVEIISGVPSFCAVAAELGISLAQGSESIHILPGCYQEKEIMDYSDCRILMKSGGKLEKVKEQLLQLEREEKIKAFGASDCGMESQSLYYDIGKLQETAGYFTTIIIKERKTKNEGKRD